MIIAGIDTDNLSYDEKLDLLDTLKEAYYNQEPLCSDWEYDVFEKELGLENEAYVGTHHNESYTVEHLFIMGSIAKIQIKFKEDGSIDWNKYASEIAKYVEHAQKAQLRHYELTPKLDGCSFEFVFDSKGTCLSASTRGDGEWGKDIMGWSTEELSKDYWKGITSMFAGFPSDAKLAVRGEVLVRLDTFDNKYLGDFKMPRSFVSGCINRDWEETAENISMRKDLVFICYDYTMVQPNGDLVELAYGDKFNTPGTHLNPEWVDVKDLVNPAKFNAMYDTMAALREKYPFALDGFILKPNVEARNPRTRQRPNESVAIKYLPEIVDTEIENIVWELGKTSELYPKAICKTCILGGKDVRNVSLSNYGKVMDKHVGVGAKIKISLAGDIIPFLYDVVSESDNVPMPDRATTVTGPHLMAILTDEERRHLAFMTSVNSLKIRGIGEKVADKLYEIRPVSNILEYMNEDSYSFFSKTLGDSRSTEIIIEELKKRNETLTIYDVILSMGFEACGEKASMQVARIISGLNADFSGLPKNIERWATDPNSEERLSISRLSETLNPRAIKEAPKTEGQIPVILTGSPKECGFATKGDFLKKHPQYVETTSWKECKILFTDDLNSSSSKMDKARKLNVEIRVYGDD